MLTKEENEILTRIGPGTPAGALLRRYWHPVAFASDLGAEQPTRLVRILCANHHLQTQGSCSEHGIMTATVFPAVGGEGVCR